MHKHLFQSQLARARGLGASHQGTAHFTHQRITAYALIPLSVWLIWQLSTIANFSYQHLIMWIEQPFNAIFLIAYILFTAYHLVLGLQMIIEDYIGTHWLKLSLLLGLKCFAVIFVLAVIYLIHRLSLMGLT